MIAGIRSGTPTIRTKWKGITPRSFQWW